MRTRQKMDRGRQQSFIRSKPKLCPRCPEPDTLNSLNRVQPCAALSPCKGPSCPSAASASSQLGLVTTVMTMMVLWRDKPLTGMGILMKATVITTRMVIDIVMAFNNHRFSISGMAFVAVCSAGCMVSPFLSPVLSEYPTDRKNCRPS